MQFKSPFHIIDPDIQPSQVKFERKKIMAHFELHDNQSIEVNGNEYTKSESLSLFEELENEQKFTYHQKIYHTPALLKFLEKGQIEDELFEQENKKLFNITGFVDFISPFFASQYSTILLKAYHSEDFRTILRLSKIPLLCSDAFYDTCFNKTTYAFTDLCKTLAKEVKQVRKNQNPFLIRQNYFEREQLIDTINALPDYFISLRDKYVRLLLEAVVDCYNLRNRGLAMRIIVQAKRLRCSAEIKEIVNNYYGQIKKHESVKLAQLESGGIENDNKGCLWIFVAVSIGILIPVIAISILTNKNKIPAKYKNIFELDTLITNSYVLLEDSGMYYHKNFFYPYIIDSIKRAEQKKVENNDIYRIMNRNNRVQRSFSSYFSKSPFISTEYNFKNHPQYFSVINNTSYDATLFIVNNEDVIHDVHLSTKDTINNIIFNQYPYNIKEYAIWLYIGSDLNSGYQFTASGKKIGYGYKKQPVEYKGVFDSDQKFQFSSESFIQDSFRITKYLNFQFELNQLDNKINLRKDTIYQYDTSIVHVYNENVK